MAQRQGELRVDVGVDLAGCSPPERALAYAPLAADAAAPGGKGALSPPPPSAGGCRPGQATRALELTARAAAAVWKRRASARAKKTDDARGSNLGLRSTATAGPPPPRAGASSLSSCSSFIEMSSASASRHAEQNSVKVTMPSWPLAIRPSDLAQGGEALQRRAVVVIVVVRAAQRFGDGEHHAQMAVGARRALRLASRAALAVVAVAVDKAD